MSSSVPNLAPVMQKSDSPIPWGKVVWFGVLLLICYAPVLASLISEWANNPDMGHGFFVPLVSGYILWQRRDSLHLAHERPSWWGLALVLLGGFQLLVATLGIELFLARTAFIVSLIGMVWLLGGTRTLRAAAFPLFLLFFMVPIPAIIYNRITFPLQILASKLAAGALDFMNVPVLREGNILELPLLTLSVVEACSGIRSLLSLTFLTLVFGYFFDKQIWRRVVLLLSTIPIAIAANAGRVTLTAVISQIKPELAQGFFHESTGWVIFMMALAILIVFHWILVRASDYVSARSARMTSA